MTTESPFERATDRILEGLRRHCGPDAYRLIPGEGDAPDRWASPCPLHPSSGFSLLVTETDGEPDLWCRVGCPRGWIRYVLTPDPERDREAARRAKAIVWAQNWRAA
jgi:hypothetical protein